MEKRKCIDIDMGEPSSTRKHHYNYNGDEKPLKKARYVWELKGKYHLKANCNAIRKSNRFHMSRDPVHSISSDSDSDMENKSHIGNKTKIIDGLLTHSNAILDTDSDPELFNIDKSISDDIPITLVKRASTQDEYLEKWQARQIAKSFVDNTINTILELWKNAPFDSSEVVKNASELIENCENDEQIEDEGILMAIQSHGLHSAPTASSFDSKPCTSGIQNEKKEVKTHFCASSLNNNSSNSINTTSNQSDDPMDFLNAAVSVAIQKKGLASCNYG